MLGCLGKGGIPVFVGKHADLTERIIGAFFAVYNSLGYGFSERLLNYLKATAIEVGLLLNFGPKAEFRRKVYDNDRKGSLAWVAP